MSKTMKLTSVIYKAGTPLRDGCTTIDAEVMKRAVDEFNKRLEVIHDAGARHYGMTEDHITHTVEKLEVNNDSIVSTLNILDTPYGDAIKKLIEQDAVHPSLEWIKCGDGKIDIKTVSIIPNRTWKQ